MLVWMQLLNKASFTGSKVGRSKKEVILSREVYVAQCASR